MSISLVGSLTTASITVSGAITPSSWAQSPTAGNLLVAVVTYASLSAGTVSITGASGWTELISGKVANTTSGNANNFVDVWYLVAAGGDALPTFTPAGGSGHKLSTLTIFELSGANNSIPLDTSGSYQSLGSATTVNFSATTGSAPAASSEFAISAFTQTDSAVAQTWTESSGFTSGHFYQNSTNEVATQVNYLTSPSTGGTLTDSGNFSTNTSSFGSGVLVVIAASGGTTHNVTANTVVSAAGSVNMMSLKLLTALAAVTSTVNRQVGKFVIAQAVATGAVIKAIKQRIVAGLTATGVLTRSITKTFHTAVSALTGLTSLKPGPRGHLQIVLEGGAVNTSNPSFPLPGLHSVSIHGTFAPFKYPTLPTIQVSLTGRVSYGRISVVLPEPATSVTGNVYHSVITVLLPTVSAQLTGTDIGNISGVLNVPLSTAPPGLRLKEEEGWVLDNPEWDTQPDEFEWFSGQLKRGWKTSLLWTGWKVMSYSQIQVNHLSTEYVLVPVQATKAGQPYNPTGDTVQFAFMPTPTQVPQNTDWVNGTWDTDTSNFLYPYSAKCLVGPSGTINLTVGTYVIYVKIEDSPEIPVLTAGQLIVT